MKNFAFLFASGLGLFACSAPPESTSADDAAYTVKPTGGAALLLVTVPAGAGVAPTLTARRDQQATQAVTAGVPLALTPGDYCVTVTLPIPKAPHVVERCGIPVKAASTTTVPLGTLTTTRVSSEKVLGIDMPFRSLSYNAPAIDPTLAFLQMPGLVPYPAGKFLFDPWASGSVADGGAATIALDDPAGRYALRIPATTGPRTLPDVPASHGIAFGLYSFDVYNYSTATAYALTDRFTRLESALFFATRGDLGAGMGPRLAVFGPGTKSSVLFYTAQLGATPNSFPFGRLDVDDVTVTMADGSTKSVRGTFTATTKKSYTPLVVNAPTGHGIDLPAGEYQVRVAYTSPVDGTAAFYDEDVTLP